MTTNERTSDTARRTVLKAVAATGAISGTSLIGGPTATVAQEGGDEDEPIIPEGPQVRLESIAEGLTAPLGLEVDDAAPDRRFVVDQAGQIYVLEGEELRDEPFLDIEDRLVDLQDEFDERGLLGLALHPDFDENGRFFVRYSAPPRDVDPGEYVPPREEVPDDYDHTFVLAAFETAGDDNTEADLDSERVLLEIPQPQFNHNAGPVAFGPDGYLYVATGDGGGASDADEGHVDDWYDENEGGNGQNTTENLLGGILRIDVDGGESSADASDGESASGDESTADEPSGNESDDGVSGGNESAANESDGDESTANESDGEDGRPYDIPADNPFAEEGEFDADQGLEEYYAWGLRNPWGMSFHGDTLFVADVGQELYEEVNIVEKGGNYGWNVREGTHCFSTESPDQPPEDCPDSTPDDVRGGESLRDPIVEYPQETEGQVIGNSVIGGHVAETETVTDLQGAYVFGDWGQTAVEPEGGKLFVAYPPTDVNLSDGEGDDATDGGSEANVSDGGAGGNATDDEGANGGNATDDDGGDGTDDDGADGDSANGEAGGSDDDQRGTEDLWEMEELAVTDPDAPPEEQGGTGLGRFLLSVGRDADGELYALTTENQGPQGETGEVFRLTVPEGDDAGGSDGETDDPADGESDDSTGDGTTFRLTGVQTGWEGEEPESIAGENNPTLEFSAGETVTVEWENGDGLPHNFVVEDESGENLVETDLVSGFGETQTVEFEAAAEMVEYYCRPHSGTMRGEVVVDGE